MFSLKRLPGTQMWGELELEKEQAEVGLGQEPGARIAWLSGPPSPQALPPDLLEPMGAHESSPSLLWMHSAYLLPQFPTQTEVNQEHGLETDGIPHC